ncbi:MAG: hypothetical protein U9O96_08435 [Candidatus Thermoplasmatota archaeon]|nr:hypothetical protein [Candidatus Thermoplasmatota archaeon]
MTDEHELEHLVMVLDYLPCKICEETIPEEERKYLCTVCSRINRSVSAEIEVPRWRVENEEVVAIDGREIEELKPSISIAREEEEEEIGKEELEVLEIGVKIPEEEVEVEEELPEWGTFYEGHFTFGEYTLYTKEVLLRGRRKQRIYFFSKKKKDDAEPCAKPEGYEVKVNEKTGLPLLKKSK